VRPAALSVVSGSSRPVAAWREQLYIDRCYDRWYFLAGSVKGTITAYRTGPRRKS
jgi:hypothetical protein